MRRVEILINYIKVGFESLSSLPLSLKRATDSFFNVVGAEGSEVDNVGSQIKLPAQKLTSNEYHTPEIPHGNPITANALPMSIRVNGITLFSGSAIFDSVERQTRAPLSYVNKLIGDGLTVWQLLEGRNLRSLDLGTIHHTDGFIQLSWLNSYATGWNGIFAPVVYGALDFTLIPEPAPNTGFSPGELRFHVYYPAIVKAIFDAVGYTIDSQFFEHEVFQDSVYVFSVGDLIPESGTNCAVIVERNFTFTYGGAGEFPVLFDDITLNTCGEWISEGYQRLEASATTQYTFTVNLEVEPDNPPGALLIFRNGVQELSFETENIQNGVEYYSENFTMDLNEGDEVEIKYQMPNGGGQMRFGVMSANPTQPIWKIGDFEDQIYEISSCLHDEEQKDFLRGITHQFCLAWNVDATKKMVMFEPRFPWRYNLNIHPSFYHNPGTGIDDYKEPKNYKIDGNNHQLIEKNPFGRSVRLQYKQTKEYYFLYKNDQYDIVANVDRDITPYSAKLALNNKDKSGTTSENPYFSVLAMGAFGEYRITSSLIPCILPESWEPGDDLPVGGDRVTDTPPRCALLHRGNLYFKYNDTNVTEGPLLCQHIDFYEPNGNALEKSMLVSYGDVECIAGQDNVFMNGLASTFHSHYLGIIKDDTLLRAAFNLSFFDVATINFRILKRVKIGAVPFLFILLNIKEFKPTAIDTTTCELVQWRPKLFTDEAKILSWNLRPFEIGETCDYAYIDSDMIGSLERDIIQIRLRNSFILPLAYPYEGSPSEATRLSNDITAMFDEMNIIYDSIIVIFTQATGSWGIQILQCNLNLYKVTRTKGGVEQNPEEFTITNCQ